MTVQLRRVLIAVLLAVFGVVGMSFGSASAHASLESSEPAPSAVLEASPSAIRLEFTEAVTPASDAVVVYDSDGDAIRSGDARLGKSSTSIVLDDLPELSDGLYAVAWRVVSSDGHLVQGAYTFTIGSSIPGDVDIGALVGEVLSARDVAAGVENVLVLVRWLSYLAVVVALGALVFHTNAHVDRARLGWLSLGSLIVLAGSSFAQFLVQGVYLTAGDWSASFDPEAWSETWSTRLGFGLVTRLVLVAILVALVLVVPSKDDHRARERVGKSWWQSSTALVATAVLLTFASGGHASAVPLAGVAVAVDVVHLGAIALWIGGLAVVLLAGRNRPEVVGQLSRLAVVAAPVTVITGLWQTWRIGGGLGELTSTDWGRGMIVKISLVIVIVALGGVARVVVRQEAPGVRRLVVVEVVLALAVLGASAYVVGESPVVARTPSVFSTTLTQGSTIVGVTVTPGLVGNNEIHVVVTPPGGVLERIPSIEMRASSPDREGAPFSVAVSGAGPNHFVGRVAFLEEGDWFLEIVLQPDPASSFLLTTEVPIKN
ncbi:MAG: copper resistance CopC/CopD family protein [Ilumatobacteraceae bacterium]